MYKKLSFTSVMIVVVPMASIFLSVYGELSERRATRAVVEVEGLVV